MTTQIIRQHVRNMTVQVRDPLTSEVCGSGVLVSPSGLLVTCAHVVRDCGADPRRVGSVLSVHIPATPEHQAEDREARIRWYPRESEDDLVLLQLAGGPVPPERVGTCGPADESDEHSFRSFGYRRRDEYLGLHAKGLIEGHVPSPRHFLVEPVQLDSRDLDSGMSGAAVFDVERNLVVGFVFQVWEPGDSAKDGGLAFAVDAAVLASSPAGKLLVPTFLKHGAMAGPEIDREMGATIFSDGPAMLSGWSVETAPGSLGAFVGRGGELDAIERVWLGNRVRILGLSGMNGQGKTSLVRTWLDGHSQGATAQRPQSVFWWTFDPAANEVDDFLAGVIKHLSGGAVDPSILPMGTAKANLAAALLQTDRRHVLVLDGLDGLQVDHGELVGSFTSQALRDFLGYAAAGQHESLCILTGPRDFRDLENLATFEGMVTDRLTPDEGRELLRHNGVRGQDHELDAIVEDWEGHALALTALAAYIRDQCGGRAQRLTDLPGGDSELPFATRLQELGNAIERQRDPLERAAVDVLALARMPLSSPELAAVIRESNPGLPRETIEPALAGLADTVMVRETADGDLLLHPVLRSLNRARMRAEGTANLRSIHRLLAEHYYRAACGAAPVMETL